MFTEEDARPYADALMALGVGISARELLERLKAGSLREDVGGALEKLALGADERELATRLVEDAVADYERAESDDDVDAGAIAALRSMNDAAFGTRLALWQAIVDATRAGRTFTPTELRFHSERIEDAERNLSEAEAGAGEDARRRARAAHDRETMARYGLLFDDAMTRDVDVLVGNLAIGRPTLIVGDKGIAKTQLAKFVMSLYGSEPVVISVKGDMMSDELIGQVRHDREERTFRFYEGPVVQAMRKGLPVLLDEINFGDQAIVARLQDVLLKKAGQRAYIQEEDAEVEIAPGFAVIATANEASSRYRHRETLDPAIRDRFEIVARDYPDIGINPLSELPESLTRLAEASRAADDGTPSPAIDSRTLADFVRVAAISEHLYAVPASEAVVDVKEGGISSSVRQGSEPLLTDCITPRALCRAVEDCAGGNLPGRVLDGTYVRNAVRSLDQAGSTRNADLMAQAMELAGIDLG